MASIFSGSAPTHSFSRLYISALATIAVLALLGQIVIQTSLQQQSSDANVINIAGRQRMLSQKISKAALVLLSPVTATQQDQTLHINELRTALKLWQRSHLGLQHGDAGIGLPGDESTQVQNLFAKIEPNFQNMSAAASQVLLLTDKKTNGGNATIAPFVKSIFANEAGFLQGMNAIVSQYQTEAQDRVTRLRYIEGALLFSTLSVLVLEGFFVFRPAIQKLNEAITRLIRAEMYVVYSEELTRKNDELAQKNAELDLAFNEALTLTQRKQPQARVIAVGHYQVQGIQGNYYNVHCYEKNGLQQLVCECALYKRNNICSHSLAAATLHTALAPHYQDDTMSHRTPRTNNGTWDATYEQSPFLRYEKKYPERL